MSETIKEKIIEYISSLFSEHESDAHMEMDIKKAVDNEQRTAMFVVLSPDEVDLHGDTYGAEEVEKACHSFALHCNKANLFHRIETEHANVVQNFINPSDFQLDDGRLIKKGAWLQVWYYPETEEGEAIWKAVKDGSINGVSIGCTCTVEKIEK